jgi:hypothetical protein
MCVLTRDVRDQLFLVPVTLFIWSRSRSRYFFFGPDSGPAKIFLLVPVPVAGTGTESGPALI